MPSICIFARAFYPAIGGLERIAQILATEMSRVGHAVEVVTDTAAVSEADDERFPFRITRATQHAHRVLAFKRADVVLFMNVTLHGMRAALKARKPLVFSHHGIYRGTGFTGSLLELTKRKLTWFYPNISVSQFVARNIPGKSVVIPNAYDNALFVQPQIRIRDQDFVFCGRLVSDKGADVCVRAFAAVLDSVPDAMLTLVGGGPERNALEDLAKSLGISANVRLLGSLSGQALVSELQRHACMVVPSLVEEGFGITALEGIACCDTVIASSRGGLPEAVGNCGVVVEPTVGEFARAMISLVKARRAGETLPGQPSEEMRKAHLARHTPEDVTRNYMNIFAQAISPRSSRGSV